MTKTVKTFTLGGAEKAETLAALAMLPKASTRARQVIVNLSAGLVDAPVDLGGLTVQAFTVLKITGTVQPSIKINGTGEGALFLTEGETRAGLHVSSLFINAAPGGGSITLELHGR